MPAASAAVGARPAVGLAAAGHVSPLPASGTPQLAPAASAEQVRQIVQCGGTMYAVGAFTAIEWGGKTYRRNNVFSFSAAAPYRITSWNPDANGEVDSIALAPNCSNSWLGGSFTQVGGTPVGYIAKVSTSGGSVVNAWAHHASAPVNTVLYTPNGHVLAGGGFTSINGSGRRFYVSLNPLTGQDDGYLNLAMTGTYDFPGAVANHTQAYNQQLSPNGKHVLVEGVFTSVQGQPRQQIFMLDLGAGHGTVGNWHSGEFSQHCNDSHPF